jgi:hypothetical protein
LADATLLPTSLVTTDNFVVVVYPSNDEFVTAEDVLLTVVVVGNFSGDVVVDNSANITINNTVSEITYSYDQSATVQVCLFIYLS